MDLGFVLTQSITQAIGVTAIIYLLATMGLNIQFGYTGLLNFGQVAFTAVGAYSVGVVVISLGMSLWLAIPIALLGAIVLALILGIPTLRLRADYLAIVTIAASEIIRLLVRSIALRDFLGGANGINGKMGQAFHDLNPLPAELLPPPAPITSDAPSQPGQGTVQCSGPWQPGWPQPGSCDYTPATNTSARYDASNGEVVGPDGTTYTVKNSTTTGDDGWKEMLAPVS